MYSFSLSLRSRRKFLGVMLHGVCHCHGNVCRHSCATNIMYPIIRYLHVIYSLHGGDSFCLWKFIIMEWSTDLNSNSVTGHKPTENPSVNWSYIRDHFYYSWGLWGFCPIGILGIFGSGVLPLLRIQQDKSKTIKCTHWQPVSGFFFFLT